MIKSKLCSDVSADIAIVHQYQIFKSRMFNNRGILRERKEKLWTIQNVINKIPCVFVFLG